MRALIVAALLVAASCREIEMPQAPEDRVRAMLPPSPLRCITLEVRANNIPTLELCTDVMTGCEFYRSGVYFGGVLTPRTDCPNQAVAPGHNGGSEQS